MRRIAFALATIAIAISASSAAPPSQDVFRDAQRLDHAELQRLIPGMQIIHIVGPGDVRYRAIDIESFLDGPGRRAHLLRPAAGYSDFTVLHHGTESTGAYRIFGDALCTIRIDETEEHCRGLYRLVDGEYALSTFEGPHSPAVKVRIIPIAASAEERFRGAERLPESTLRNLIPGMQAIYLIGPGEVGYRGIHIERYQTRPGLHAISLRGGGAFNSLRVFYDLSMGLGSYRIRDNSLCSILAGETQERCRSVYRLPGGLHALSTFEDPDAPAVRIRLEPIQ